MELFNIVTNINQIAVRSHGSLQNLNKDDHKQYGVIVDLYANIPSASSTSRLFYASDTDTLYISNGTSWTSISNGGGNIYATLNKVLTFSLLSDMPGAYSSNASKILSVNGSGNGLLWRNISGWTKILTGSGGGDYSTNSGTFVDVDATNLKVTLSGLTLGQPIFAYYACQINAQSGYNTSVTVNDITNSQSFYTFTSGSTSYVTGTNGSNLSMITALSTSLTLSLQFHTNGGTGYILNSGSTGIPVPLVYLMY